MHEPMKPCPFCGAPGEITMTSSDGVLAAKCSSGDSHGLIFAWVKKGNRTEMAKDRGPVIAEWNKRHVESEPAGDIPLPKKATAA